MNDRQEAKLDKAIGMMHEMLPQVADTKSDVRFLRSENMKVQKQQERHDERIDSLGGDVNALGAKVRDHVGKTSLHRSATDVFKDSTVRWTWIAKVAGAFTALFVLIGVLAKGLIK